MSEQQAKTTRRVYVVDNDDGLRHSLKFALEQGGYDVQAFESARAFLDVRNPGEAGCLLVDIRMPDMTGIELERHLAETNDAIPVIVMTGHGDVATAVEAMKLGAVDYLEKPVNRNMLIDRIEEALRVFEASREQQEQTEQLQSRLSDLTRRERQLLGMIVDGWSSKQIAAELGISENTVNNHRAHMMKKMGAANTAEMVRMAVASGFSDTNKS